MKPLFIVTTGGGLGNQIMSFALWLYLRKRGRNTHLYLKRNFLIEIFKIENNFLKNLYCWDMLLYVIKKIGRFKKVLKKERKRYVSFLGLNVVDYPEWHDYKFISEILPELKKKLIFTEDDNENNKRIVKMMQESESVSIHVRRGDYQNSVSWRIILGDICDRQYYRDAIDRVCAIFLNPKFFVFSDDIEWVKLNLHIDNSIYIDWNIGENSYRDMELMTYCKANIIANSTFSLCAAWLNVNKNPTRVVPSKWLNDFHDNLLEKYIPSDWIVVDNKKPKISIIVRYVISYIELRHILKQKYSDFEIIMDDDELKKMDNRIISGNPRGLYIYNYSHEDVKRFTKQDYLLNWLSGIYIREFHRTANHSYEKSTYNSGSCI